MLRPRDPPGANGRGIPLRSAAGAAGAVGAGSAGSAGTESGKCGACRASSAGSDAGAGSVLGVALIAAIVCAVLAALPVYIGMGARQATIAAADAAALAGADVAVGIFPGVPCEVARAVASANGSEMDSCAVNGLIVTVSTMRSFLGLKLHATATAGPPGSPSN